MNFNNLAQKTNYIAGSPQFEKMEFYLTTLNIPGLNIDHPKIGGRQSVKMNLNADSISYNNLSLELLIDEDFKLYIEFMNTINKHIDIKNGTFKDFTFDFWVELNNSKGNKILKLEFSNCRLTSIGDINLDTQDDITEHVLNIELIYDYYQFEQYPNLIQSI